MLPVARFDEWIIGRPTLESPAQGHARWPPMAKPLLLLCSPLFLGSRNSLGLFEHRQKPATSDIQGRHPTAPVGFGPDGKAQWPTSNFQAMGHRLSLGSLGCPWAPRASRTSRTSRIWGGVARVCPRTALTVAQPPPRAIASRCLVCGVKRPTAARTASPPSWPAAAVRPLAGSAVGS